MPKSAIEKLQQKKEPKQVVLDKDFAGIKSGQRMLVSTPADINGYIRKIPRGKFQSIPELREKLARKHQCDATCPVSTAIFLRIVAEAALEELDAGKSVDRITPFWRVIDADSKIAAKLPVDSQWITLQREMEQ